MSLQHKRDNLRPNKHKEIKPVNLKGNKSWIVTERTNAEAEAPILWPPDAKNWLTGKDPDAGKDWRQEEIGTTEDEMAGWYHKLDGHVWASSGSWWWTGKPGVLQSVGFQKVRHNWVTELHWNVKRKRMKLIKANEDKMPSEEKGLFYPWDILYKPHGNHKT